jgi:uncharacterized delta-60 repeat protein
LVRYLPDGRLDHSFSRDGLATIDFGNSYEGAEALVLQPNGKILIAGGGGRNYDFALARFRPDGRLDRTFSHDGRMTVSFGPGRWDAVHGLALQRDGRIVAAGSSTAGQIGPARIAVARITRKGSLDRSFGTRGRVLTNPVPAGGFAKAVLVLPDGRIVVAGLGYETRNEALGSDWVLVRYTPAGRLDRSFGGDGIVVSSFGTGADWAGALARQGDGKIVAAGEIYRDQAVARYFSR